MKENSVEYRKLSRRIDQIARQICDLTEKMVDTRNASTEERYRRAIGELCMEIHELKTRRKMLKE